MTVHTRHARYLTSSLRRHSRALLAFITEQDARLTVAAVKASRTLAMPTNPSNTQTVTLGARTYTFQTTLTNVDGNVLIGGTAALSLANLYAAQAPGSNGGVAGTNYAAATTAHSTIEASGAPSGTNLGVRAKTGGTAGNALATTTTVTGASFGGATLSGGVAATVFSTLTALLKNPADHIRAAASAAGLVS